MSDETLADIPEPTFTDDEAPDDQDDPGVPDVAVDTVNEADGSEADRLDQLTGAPLDAEEDDYRR
ncbi:MAG: hypothetical protein L0H79_06110 [Intrasporangium sp.]|uniref:hypothetical protein n=1 Tax=Intrasporangium sp. TaxID=1925024 RepID=UPI002648D4E0|nr:hypothetical protein [Intrasporangium sp.]MDN5795313.1 hypothetical protein [Intrasporangium sp.]